LELDRRTFLAGSLSLAAAPQWPPAESFRLWPGDPPDRPDIMPTPHVVIEPSGPQGLPTSKISGVAEPRLNVFRPQRPNGIALLVTPGGSYVRLSVGDETGNGLVPFGYTIFVLTYRLPGEGWRNRSNVPLQDAQRAMRLIKSRAADYAIDADRVCVLGFSAGGHLAASLATGFEENLYHPVDQADRLSAKPRAAGLLYPVIDMHPGFAHMKSRENLLGPDPGEALMAARSPHLRVSGTTPPCFLAHALDDHTVAADNSLLMLAALRAQQIPAEAHLFESGGHGFGFGQPWADRFQEWLGKHA
jgi:acetyl esterase/lipase